MTHLDTILVHIECLDTRENYTIYDCDEGMTLLEIRYRIKQFIRQKWPTQYRYYTFIPTINIFNKTHENEIDCLY